MPICAAIFLTQPALLPCSEALAAPPAKNQSPTLSYRKGMGFLLNDPAQAVIECRRAVTDTALRNWALLCVAKGLADQGQKSAARKEIEKIDAHSAAGLHARALELELSTIDAKWGERRKALADRVTVLNIGELRSVLLLLQAREEDKKGNVGSALTLYQSVREGSPRSRATRLARADQQRLLPSPGGKLPATLKSGFNASGYWKKELALLEAEGEFSTALAAVKALLADSPPSISAKKHFELLMVRWRLMRALRQGTAAEKERLRIRGDKNSTLRFLVLGEEALEHWRRGRYDEARKTLTLLPADHPDRFFVEGRLAEIDRDFAAARRGYSQALKTDSDQRLNAGLRLLWLEIEAEDWKAALQTSRTMLRKSSELPTLDAQAVQFWSTRIEEKLRNDSTAANDAAPGDLADQFPAVYYWMKRGFSLSNPGSRQADISFTRCADLAGPLPELPAGVQSLIDAEFRDLASQELRAHYSKTKSLADVLIRARLLGAHISHPAAWNEIRARYSLPKAYWEECGRNILDVLYPMPYLDLYRREATHYQVPLPLVLALSRTESAFQKEALSPAGAVGLMQLMPATARLEGLKSNKPIAALQVPETNIGLGVKHLAKLISEQGGKWHYTVASYNAGKAAVARWNEQHPNVDPALWTELVPYKETRNYVKQVIATYWVYEWLLRDSGR